MSKTSSVPRNRVSRFARLGGLAGGIAGGMIAEGVRQLSRGNLPSPSDLVLTPGNARRVAEQLANLRGAAMKLGQLLSMDSGALLPPELAEILARLRADARPMPMSQLVAVLGQSWGRDWEKGFQRFSFTPLAAASIGQVHSAVAKDGRRLALKVLGQHGITSVLVEGGGTLLGYMFDHGLIDKVVAFIAPVIIGGHEAETAVGGKGAEKITDSIHLEHVVTMECNGDVMISGYVGGR